MDKEAFNNFINQDFNKFSNGLFSLSAFEFALVGTIIGFTVSSTLSSNQQNSLGNFFTLIGQVLMTENAQNITLAQEKRKNSNFKPGFQYNNQNDEILNIKNEMFKMFDELYGNK